MPASETDRVEHTRLRRRILYGLWRDDLRERIREDLRSPERADAWGQPDLTGDVLTPICTALSTLYTPDLPRAYGDATVLAAVEAGGLWQLMARVQRDTIGLRECLVRVDAHSDPLMPGVASLSYRASYPDRCVLRPSRHAPDLPAYVLEAVQIERSGRVEWGWEEWSIEDPAAPFARLLSPDREQIYEAREGEAYPHRDADGQPVLPYSLYHAERTGRLWDPWEWSAVVEGALRLGVYWTYYGHMLRSASWPQRYLLGAWMAGDVHERTDDRSTSSTSTAPRLRVVADPARVLMLSVDPESTVQPQVGAWGPGGDPVAVAASIGTYERRVVSLTGMGDALLAKHDGDPRSGYAVSVSRDGQEAAARRYTPVFSRGDLETLRVSAAVLGSALGRPLPGSGYVVEYGAEVAPTSSLTPAAAQSLLAGLQAASSGQIPRDAAVQYVRLVLGLADTEAADRIVASAGTEPPPPPEPLAPPPPDDEEDPDG